MFSQSLDNKPAKTLQLPRKKKELWPQLTESIMSLHKGDSRGTLLGGGNPGFFFLNGTRYRISSEPGKYSTREHAPGPGILWEG